MAIKDTAYKTIMSSIHELIHSKFLAILVILVCCGTSEIATAQGNNGNYNFREFEAKPYYFGITLGLNQSQFKPFFSDQFILNDSISQALTPNGGGFNLGIVTNLKIGKYFDFRFLPTLSFAERLLEYTPTNDGIVLDRDRSLSAIFGELPFHIRYKSETWNDLRVFVVGGIKYSFDVASDSRARQVANLLKISPNDYTLEIGAGLQFFFPYFIFSPEIKYSHGLGNVLINEQNVLQSAIFQRLNSRTLTLSFHFEG